MWPENTNWSACEKPRAMSESSWTRSGRRFFAAWLDAYPFAADVLLEIQPDDFCKTVALGTPHAGKYDIYGVQISEALAARHGLAPRVWYVKLRLYEAFSGEVVFFVSLHPLEFDMERVGGLLRK